MRTLPKLMATLPLAVYMGCSLAESNTYNFNIPAQSLSSALSAVSKQTGLQPFYADEAVAGKQSPALKGTYSKQQAVAILLADSGLNHSFTGNNSVAVKAKSANEQQADNSIKALATITVRDKADKAGDDPYNKDYAAPTNTTATKTVTPFLETPGTVNVVTKGQMEDRQVFDAVEALKYTSGVNPSAGGRSPYDSAFYLRGFSNAEQPGGLGGYYYRDGFRMSGIPLPTANLERLELLKGPAAVLYGRAEPGGLVNAVYKRPLDKPYYKLEQQFGSYSLYRTIVDATGPVPGNKNLLYRFNLQNLDQGSFRQNLNNNLLSISPSLTWLISDATKVNFQYEYTHNEWNYPSAIPAVGNRPANIPFNRFLGDGLTGKPDWFADTHIGNMDVTHQINDNWALRWNALFAHQHLTGVTPVSIGSINEDTGDVKRGHITAEPNNPQRRWWFTSLNLTGNVDTFGIKHKLLFGFDYNNERYHANYYFQSFDFNFNIYNPVYGRVNHATLDSVQASENDNNFYDLTQINRWYGLYLQDQIELTKQLHLVLGGRYDSAEWGFDYTNQLKPSADSRFNPRYGIVYQPLSWLSTYYQYTESFGTPNGRPAPGEPAFKPQVGRQHELGIKTEFFNGRLNSNLAFYYLAKNNLLVTNPNDPTHNTQVAVGEARSQGIELDITGKVTEQLNLIASYSYTATKVTKDKGIDDAGNLTNGNQGNQLSNVPKNAGSLWATYDITEAFKLGAGVYLAGQRQGDLANSYQLPGYGRLDMMASYKWRIGKSQLTTQINVNNVLDKQYYTNSDTSRSGGAFPGQPLTAIGSIRLEF